MDERNDDIEKFFERRLQHAEFPFNENDWENLKERLDEDDALAGTASTGGRWIWVGLVGIAFLAGWFLHDILSESSISDNDVPIAGIEETQTTMERGEENLDGEKTTNNYISSDEEESVLSSSSETEIAGEQPGRSEQLSQSETKSTGRPVKIISGDTGLKEESVSYMSESDDHSRKPDVPDQAFFSPGNPEWQKKSFEPFPQSLTIWVPEKVEIQESVNEEIPLGEKEKDRSTGHWSLGIGLSPDMNSTGMGETWQVSGEIGLQVFYAINSQWSLNTGLFYSNKRYLASGDQYNPPEGYWDYFTDGMIPEEVRAVCGIMDLPINLNFTVNPDSKIRFFIGTGISNYFILNEDYKYSFNDPNYYGSEGWQTTENSSAWLGYINGSIGIESFIGKDWSLRVEPYAKIPIKKVGYGKVDLFGSGFMFTIRKHFKAKE